MKKNIAILISIILLGVLPITSFAKRQFPPEAEPISKEGIIYSSYGEDSILATDEKTRDQIWKRQIYVVKHIPGWEHDVQACFITKIEIQDNSLIITNEKNYKYELHLNTLEIKVIKGSILIDIKKDYKETF